MPDNGKTDSEGGKRIMALNFAVIQGNFVETPELKLTPSNNYIVSFRFAWNEKSSSGNEKTLFIRCTAWREKAEFISKYFTKGQQAIISGKLVTNEFTDKEGNKRSNIDLYVSEIQFCGKKEENAQTQFSAPSYIPLRQTKPTSGGSFEYLSEDDDLPF